MKKLDSNTRQEIEKNVFKAAHPAIENWDLYPWHRHGKQITTGRLNSSQALSLEVFGTLKAMQTPPRDAVMNAVAVELGMEPDQEWDIKLEWTDDHNRLNERRKTQVDVKAQSRKNLLLMECKFTEEDGGSCSQVKPLQTAKHRGIRQCSGAYKRQVNPVNGKEEWCALSGKGIRYWELIPELFLFNRHQNHEECPFKGGWFQWMRNLVLCWEIARTEHLRPKVAVVYADAPGMPFRQKVHNGSWDKFLSGVRAKPILGIISYQRILELGATALRHFDAEQLIWEDLKKHVQSKVTRVESDKW